jgi:hypothetical protein
LTYPYKLCGYHEEKQSDPTIKKGGINDKLSGKNQMNSPKNKKEDER